MAGRRGSWMGMAGTALLVLGLGAGVTACVSLLQWVEEAMEEGETRELRFVAREAGGDQAVWHPTGGLLEGAHALGDLVFVLENPTSMQHAFVMPEAKLIVRERVLRPESSADIPYPIRVHELAPLAVVLQPGETRHVRVSTSSLPRTVGTALRYFCTIHKDVAQAGTLYLL